MALFASDVLAEVNKVHKLPQLWSFLGKNDIALVTGGLSGLGLEITKKLVFDHQITVIVLDIKEPQFDFGNLKVVFHHCDVGIDSQLKTTLDSLLKGLQKKQQHISILVNNAGVRNSGSLLKLEDDAISQAFGVNLFAQITILRKIIANHIHLHPRSQLSVVSVSSILGTLAPKNLLVYSASKAAVMQIHESLTQELKQYSKIRMLLVSPGQLTTDMFSDVSPSRLFFAPLVNHIALAGVIVEKINCGEAGILCEPFYANFLPLVKTLPLVFQSICRWFSQMDEKITDSK